MAVTSMMHFFLQSPEVHYSGRTSLHLYHSLPLMMQQLPKEKKLLT